MKKSRLPSAPVRKFAPGRRYRGVRGKVVNWVEHTFEEGMLYIHVRFTDKTELSWRITTRMTIEESDLADWTSGDFTNYESSSETKKTGACDAPKRRWCLRLSGAGNTAESGPLTSKSRMRYMPGKRIRTPRSD